MSWPSNQVPPWPHFSRCMDSGCCVETALQTRDDHQNADGIFAASPGLIGGTSKYRIIRGTATLNARGNFAIRKTIRFQLWDSRLAFDSKMRANQIREVIAWRRHKCVNELRHFL
jgi:hypothetical protein